MIFQMAPKGAHKTFILCRQTSGVPQGPAQGSPMNPSKTPMGPQNRESNAQNTNPVQTKQCATCSLVPLPSQNGYTVQPPEERGYLRTTRRHPKDSPQHPQKASKGSPRDSSKRLYCADKRAGLTPRDPKDPPRIPKDPPRDPHEPSQNGDHVKPNGRAYPRTTPREFKDPPATSKDLPKDPRGTPQNAHSVQQKSGDPQAPPRVTPSNQGHPQNAHIVQPIERGVPKDHLKGTIGIAPDPQASSKGPPQESTKRSSCGDKRVGTP
jgi:hypothetical protein